ncbi:MAG TPA: hypothetical protein VD993_06625 [Chitinophagaceae bacterium]|nr:hypothetical protein [Chitinophagaceae bacterium]
MYNPFPLLTESILNNRVWRGKRYFVRQSFLRGFSPGLKASFLLRAYAATEREQALTHMAFIAHDAYAYLYDASNPAHFAKLQVAASQPAGYRIYYAGKEVPHWNPSNEYDFKIRRYILSRHPRWWTQRGRNSIHVGLCEEWGELLLKLSFENEQEIIPFDEIEK